MWILRLMKLLLLIFHCFSCLVPSRGLLHRLGFSLMRSAILDHYVVLIQPCLLHSLLICLIFRLTICKCLVYLNYTSSYYNHQSKVTYHFIFCRDRKPAFLGLNETQFQKEPLTAGRRSRLFYSSVNADWQYSWHPEFDCFSNVCFR